MVLALPDIIALAAALVALLIVAGLILFARMAGGFMRVIPFVGGFLEDATVGISLTVLQRLEGWLLDAIRPMAKMLLTASLWLDNMTWSVLRLAFNLQNQIDIIIAHYLQDAVIRGATAGLHWVMQLYDPGIAALKDGEAHLWSFVMPLQDAWSNYIVPTLNTFGAQLLEVPHEIAAGVEAAEAWAQQEIAREVAGLSATVTPALNALGSAVASVPAEIAAAVSGAERFTTTAVGQVTTTVEGIQQQVTTQVLPVEATLAAQLAAVAAQVSTLTDFVDECGVPMCNDWRGMSSLLNTLRNVFAVAGVAEFLQAAAHDPQGTARGFAAVAGGLGHEAAGLWDTVLAL